MQTEPERFAPEPPTLFIGLLGFDPEQESAVEAVLQTGVDTGVRWRVGPLSEAEVWLANGAHVRPLDDGSLRIAPGAAGGSSVRLSPADVDRPIAFSEPLASGDFEPALTFRVDDPASIARTMAVMQEQWLLPTVARLWLGGWLIAAERVLTHRIYEVLAGSRLLAVIDRMGSVGVVPGATIADLAHADFVGRSLGAATVPPQFHRATLSELVWTYASRAEAPLLPSRYFTGPIFFRRLPKVPQQLVAYDHLLLIAALASAPATFGDLRERTGLEELRLARALAALYFAGSITTSPARANRSPDSLVTKSSPLRSGWASSSRGGLDTSAQPGV